MKKVMKFVKSKRYSAGGSSAHNSSTDNHVLKHSESFPTKSDSNDINFSRDEFKCKITSNNQTHITRDSQLKNKLNPNNSPEASSTTNVTLNSKNTPPSCISHSQANTDSLNKNRQNTNIERSIPEADVLSILSSEREDLSLISCSPQSAKIPPPCKPLRSLEYLHSEIFTRNDLQETKTNLVVLGTVRTRHISFSETNEQTNSVNRLSYPGDSAKDMTVSLNENVEKVNTNDKQSTSASESDWGSDKSLPLSNPASLSSNSNKSSLTRKPLRPRSEIYENNVLSEKSSLTKTNASRHFKRYSLDYNIKPSESPHLMLKQPFSFKYNPPIHENISQLDIDDILDDNRRINDQLETYDDALKHLEQFDLKRVHHKSLSLPRTEIKIEPEDSEKFSLSLPRSLTSDDAFKDIKTVYSQSHRSLWRRDKVAQQTDTFYSKKHFLQRVKNLFDDKWKKRRFGKITHSQSVDGCKVYKNSVSSAGELNSSLQEDENKQQTDHAFERYTNPIQNEDISNIKTTYPYTNNVNSQIEEPEMGVPTMDMSVNENSFYRSPKSNHALLCPRIHSTSKEQVELYEKVTFETHRAEVLARDLAEVRETLNGRNAIVDILQTQLANMEDICNSRTSELEKTKIHHQKTQKEIAILKQICEQYESEIRVSKLGTVKGIQNCYVKELELKEEGDNWRKQYDTQHKTISEVVDSQCDLKHNLSDTQTEMKILMKPLYVESSPRKNYNTHNSMESSVPIFNIKKQCSDNEELLCEYKSVKDASSTYLSTRMNDDDSILELTITRPNYDEYTMLMPQTNIVLKALDDLKQTLKENNVKLDINSRVDRHTTSHKLAFLQTENMHLKDQLKVMESLQDQVNRTNELKNQLECLQINEKEYKKMKTDNKALKDSFEKLLLEQSQRESDYEDVIQKLKIIDEKSMYYKNKIDNLISINNQLDNDLKESYRENKQLLSHKKLLADQSTELNAKNENFKLKIQHLTQTIERLQKEYALLAEESCNKDSTIEKQNKTIDLCTEDIDRLNTKMEYLVTELETVKSRNTSDKEDLKIIMKSMQEDLNNKCKELTRLNEQGEALVANYKLELKNIKSEKLALKKQVQENTTERNNLRKEIGNLYDIMSQTVQNDANTNSLPKYSNMCLNKLVPSEKKTKVLFYKTEPRERTGYCKIGEQRDYIHRSTSDTSNNQVSFTKYHLRQRNQLPGNVYEPHKSRTDTNLYHIPQFSTSRSWPDISQNICKESGILEKTKSQSLTNDTVSLFHPSTTSVSRQSNFYWNGLSTASKKNTGKYLDRTHSQSLPDLHSLQNDEVQTRKSNIRKYKSNFHIENSMPSSEFKSSTSSSYTSCVRLTSVRCHDKIKFKSDNYPSSKRKETHFIFDCESGMNMNSSNAEMFKSLITSFQSQLDRLQRRVNEETDRHSVLADQLHKLQGEIVSRDQFNEQLKTSNFERDQADIHAIETRIRKQFLQTKLKLQEDLTAVQSSLQDKYSEERELRAKCQELADTVQKTEFALRKQIVDNARTLPVRASSSRHIAIGVNIPNAPCDNIGKKTEKTASELYRQKLDDIIRENRAAADLTWEKRDGVAYTEKLSNIAKNNLRK